MEELGNTLVENMNKKKLIPNLKNA